MAVAIVKDPDGRTNHIELARVHAEPVPETRGIRLAMSGPAFDAVFHLDPGEAADLARDLQAILGQADAPPDRPGPSS